MLQPGLCCVSVVALEQAAERLTAAGADGVGSNCGKALPGSSRFADA